MKPVLSFFFVIFCLVAMHGALGQTHIPRPNTPLSAKAKGYYEYLPQGYNANGTDRYPLILFLHGIGEFGRGNEGDLPKVLKNGIPKFIEAGTFPKSFTVKGVTHRFIIISPQFISSPRPTAADIDEVLNSIVKLYKVDTARIYLTGLSYGGGLTFAYPGHNAVYAQRVAAILPVSTPDPLGNKDSIIYVRSRMIAANNVPVWATHNERDSTESVVTVRTYIKHINEPTPPNPPASLTVYNANGHDAWTRTYNPDNKIFGSDANLNIYEWMLQYQRVTNKAPVAAAGADQTITLPANSVTLNGSGTDSDGTIATYSWAKISGPAGEAITSPKSATTTVTGLAEGNYTFRLTITDNDSATATDDVTVQVNAAPNKAPVADAGPDQSITLPANSIVLNGTATDSDGTIQAVSWTKTEGPACSIASPGAAKTTVTAMAAGTYTFRFTATDNTGASDSDFVKITVNAAANKAPVANAGGDITIALPDNQVILAGSGTDEDGTIASYLWTKVSGPSGGSIVAKDAAATSVTGLVQGTYVFRLTVTDNEGANNFDELSVVVLTAPNVPPVANAGADQAITLPSNQVTLTGTGTDSDGSIAAYAWTKISGPAAGTITSANAATATVTGLVEGSYIFQLTVTDNDSATATDKVVVTVSAAPNVAPQANAGEDQTIALPTNSVSLSGTGTDSDGTISSYAWTKVSGSGGTITTPNAQNTTITNLQEGAYVFRLTVTDDDSATAVDDVTITVNAALNKAPIADAGGDQTITLPTNSITVSGTGTDSDGSITTYSWTKISGPAGANIATPNSAATSVTGLVEGSYTFRLTVTDDRSATASDEVTITVNAVPNQAPTANAGTDQSITLPTSTATLSGSGTDADGAISSYIWAKVSGPDGGTLATPDAHTTTVTALQQGTYVFSLTVTDDKGATASDSVRIEVTVVTGTGDDPAAIRFEITATPNPTANQFLLKIASSSPKPVYLRLTDAIGRIVEERTTVQPNVLFSIGHNYTPGIYHAEAIQNGKKTTLKLLKW
jgi:dienelactone hydrolase